ncbi:aminotransferase class IV, partial [Salinibacter ruber]|uniref:aminotransferase class IV n=1 Tax=Salinibacter ruber TaxID=146919 RepID=UPI003C6E938A
GFDEAILLNQDGQVTEGAYSNVFVRRMRAGVRRPGPRPFGIHGPGAPGRGAR